MSNATQPLLARALENLLRELLTGPEESGPVWVLDNNPSAGVLGTLGRLTAAEASSHPVPGHPSVAAHANHLRFSLELFNRASRGEDAYSGADWPGSWRVQEVDEAAWASLRAALEREGKAALEVVAVPRSWDDEVVLTGTIGNVAHAAYHLGAMRQLVNLVRPA